MIEDYLRLEKACLAVLQRQDDVALIEWSHMLNSWEWPEELPLEESFADSRSRGVFSRRGQIRTWIENRLGQRAVLRDHNKDMTDEEFADFWDGCYRGDAEAAARYYKRLEDEVYHAMGIEPDLIQEDKS